MVQLEAKILDMFIASYLTEVRGNRTACLQHPELENE
jgi:hypothetical protein